MLKIKHTAFDKPSFKEHRLTLCIRLLFLGFKSKDLDNPEKKNPEESGL